jgi:adenylosuccinate synthase
MPAPAPGPSPAAPANAPAASCTAVVGLQWGDEGKGKAVDLLAATHDAVVRYNGGANAGHSVVVGGHRFSLHLVPSGILYPGKAAVIGNGVVVDPEKLIQELDSLAQRGVDTSALLVSDRAHVVAPYHKAEDERREEILKSSGDVAHELGTTRRGIGPCYAEKVHRSAAIRMGDLLRPDALRFKLALARAFRAGTPLAEFEPGKLAVTMERWGNRLAPMITDTVYHLHALLDQGKTLLFEGANATLLDVDHGTYPFVTASSCSALGVGVGTGVSERRLSRVLGVMKAYSTRVGRGPMPTELHDATGDGIRERGNEYGTTTRRPRRIGWLDLVAVRYAAMLSEPTGLVVTLLDVLSGVEELKVCTAYRVAGRTTDRFLPDSADLERAEPVYQSLPGFSGDATAVRRRQDLPDSARRYLDFIEEFVGVPIRLVGVGPGREQTIQC